MPKTPVAPTPAPAPKRQHGISKQQAAHGTESSSLAAGYKRLQFVPFCAARQAVLINRRNGLPREQWTTDRILIKAKFCNIDRRDDADFAKVAWAGLPLLKEVADGRVVVHPR